ncbi:hypothetical protein [Vibrio diabolicus]|uniref:hypothetical protein n=1 Tax=Vibrio diabolicus TaxID=50719 RepID=UPI0034D6F61F
MRFVLNKVQYNFASFSFLWFLGIYPFLALLNSFGYINIFGLYLVNIVICIILLAIQIFVVRLSRVSFVYFSIFASLIIIVITLILGGWDIYGNLENGRTNTVVNYFLPFVINSIGMYCLGYQLKLDKIIQSKYIFILLLPSIFILFHIKGFRLDYSLLKDPSLIGIYLIVGDAICISSAFLCFRKGFNLFTFIMYLFFLTVLYLNNSRASFFIFMTSFAIVILWYLSINKTLRVSLVISIFICIFPFIYDSVINLLSLNDRMAIILSGGSDYSSNSRDILFDLGVNAIIDNWLFGDLGGQIHTSGRLGGYIHNILAYWRQFGLVPFLLIVSSIVYIVIQMLYLSFRVNKKQESSYLIVFLCLTIAVTMIFTARSIPYYLLFFAIALADNFRIEHYKHQLK